MSHSIEVFKRTIREKNHSIKNWLWNAHFVHNVISGHKTKYKKYYLIANAAVSLANLLQSDG